MNALLNAQQELNAIAGIMEFKIRQNMPVYYSIKIIRGGVTALLINRNEGVVNFNNDVNTLMKEQKPDAIIVELFTGKTRKVKEPECSYYIDVAGQHPVLQNNGQGLNGVHSPAPVQQQNSVSELLGVIQQSFTDQLSQQKNNFDTMLQTEVLRFRIQQLEQENLKLKETVNEQSEELEALELELEKRPQLGKPGKLNFYELGSYWLESFIKRNPGIIQTAFNIPAEQIAGVLGTTQTGTQTQPTENSSAKVSVSVAPAPSTENLTPEQKEQLQRAEQAFALLKGMPFERFKKVFNLLVITQDENDYSAALLNYAEHVLFAMQTRTACPGISVATQPAAQYSQPVTENNTAQQNTTVTLPVTPKPESVVRQIYPKTNLAPQPPPDNPDEQENEEQDETTNDDFDQIE
jgi:hypothetical protein